jgi:hypothetical protein
LAQAATAIPAAKVVVVGCVREHHKKTAARAQRSLSCILDTHFQTRIYEKKPIARVLCGEGGQGVEGGGGGLRTVRQCARVCKAAYTASNTTHAHIACTNQKKGGHRASSRARL